VATFFWVGGTGTLNNTGTTHISATTGGAAGAGPCTATDNIVMDANSGGGTVTVVASTFVDFSITGGTMTLAGSGALAINGSFSLPAAGLTRTYTGAITFGATSTGKTITTNGVSLASSITFNGVGGGWTLGGALTTTGSMTLTNGALDLGGFTLTCFSALSNNTNVRSIAFGTGKLSVSGNGTVAWNYDYTNFTLTGTPVVEFTYSGSTGTRTISGSTGATETTVPTMKIIAGSDALTLQAASLDLDFTGFGGTLNSGNRTVYGNLTFAAAMTVTGGGNVTTFSGSGSQTVTTAGLTLDLSFTMAGTGTLKFTTDPGMSAARTFTLTSGTLDLNGHDHTTGLFSSNNTNTRAIAFGTNKIVLTALTGNIWNGSTATGFTYTGTPRVDVTGAGSTTRTVSFGTTGGTETNAPSLNVTAGTDTALTMSGAWKNVDFTGFAGVLANATRTIYGNVTLAVGMTYSQTAAMTFSATSGTQQFTTTGITVDGPVTQNNPGATLKLMDALTMGSTRNFALTAGTLDLNNLTLSCQTFPTSSSNVRAITFGSGTISVNTNFTATTATNLTVTPGTGKISMSSASGKAFAGGGVTTYPNLENSGAGVITVTGANTFADLTITTGSAGFVLPASTTTTVSALSLSGTITNQVALSSSSAGTPATLSKALGTVSVSYLTITDIAATGGATFNSYTTNGNVDNGGNSGWNFSPPGANTGNFFQMFH
jgi:hypothetical protein